MTRDTARSTPGVSVRGGAARRMSRALPEEVPVALVYDGTTQAVMMATPDDLADFALGFSLTEGIVAERSDIREIEIVDHGRGIEARMWLSEGKGRALQERRRSMLGPVGCGLCGIDSLDAALRDVPQVDATLTLTAGDINAAVAALRARQPLQDQTRAVHAAGFWQPGSGLTHVREDVGRHNALDKLVGALWNDGIEPAGGAVVLTSRVSLDMVQKTAILGAPVLIAASAPTVHAVRLAEAAGITVVAGARGDGFDIYTHDSRIDGGTDADVA